MNSPHQKIPCPHCGTPIIKNYPCKPIPKNGERLCKACRTKWSNSHPDELGNYKGGRRLTADGYIQILWPDRPPGRASRYILEHRHIMQKILKRRLDPKEVVHHINGIKTDNRPENLLLFKHQGEHKRLHGFPEWRRSKIRCKICGGPNNAHGLCSKHYLNWYYATRVKPFRKSTAKIKQF